MHRDSIRPRPRGTGSLLLHTDASGSSSWYGKWRVEGRQVMRKLGEAREPGSRQGLTRGQAEALLVRARTEAAHAPASSAGIEMAEAGRKFLAHKQTMGLKRSTLMDYESCIRVHLVPFFGPIPLEQIDIELVEAFMAAKRVEGKALKSVQNYTVVLHAIFGQGVRRGWCSRNPVADVDKPRSSRTDPDIRFLTNEELEALLAATPTDELGTTERMIYLAAAMTGMRRGEILALRWQDVDMSAGLIRVRRNYARGEFGTPKSRRSSRTVPLAERLRSELEQHHARSSHRRELDLVFCHPGTGSVYDPSRLRKRFQAAARRAELRPVRFHDLRHTFGTRMASAGAPLRAVQEWMGHSDYRTTSLYADYAPDLSQGAHWAARAFTPPPKKDGQGSGKHPSSTPNQTSDRQREKHEALRRVQRPRGRASGPHELSGRLAVLRAEGATLSAIANLLNEEGTATPQGGRLWYPAGVRSVLRTRKRELEADGT